MGQPTFIAGSSIKDRKQRRAIKTAKHRGPWETGCLSISFPIWYIITTMKAGLIYQEKWVQENRAVEIRVWAVPKAKDKPHGYKYSLVYI